MMRRTFLSSGASPGDPAIGCRFPVSLFSRPRINERFLSSEFNIKTARFSLMPKEETEGPASRFAEGRG